jgi:hypothetical protein
MSIGQWIVDDYEGVWLIVLDGAASATISLPSSSAPPGQSSADQLRLNRDSSLNSLARETKVWAVCMASARS